MKKIFVIVALVAVLVGATSITALAGFTWCSTDPNIQLPDGSVFHLWVAVPPDEKGTGFTLTVTAPEGSRIVGHSNKVAMTVVLLPGPDGQVSASADAGFEVRFTAKYRNQEWEPVYLTGTWDY